MDNPKYGAECKRKYVVHRETGSNKMLDGILLSFVENSVMTDVEYTPGRKYKGGIIKNRYPHGILVEFNKVNSYGTPYTLNSFYTYQDIFFGFTPSEYKPTKEYGKI